MNGMDIAILGGGDLRIFDFNLGENFADRIYVTNGTDKLEGPRAEAAFYLSPSYVPGTPFKHPVADELRNLVTSDHVFDPAGHIGLVAIPGELWQPVVDILVRHKWNEGSAKGAGACATAVTALEEGLVGMFSAGGAYVSHGLSSHPPSLITVTINRDRGAYNGLHLDSWDGTTLNDRKLSRVRVCLNLGPEPRYFLFLNRSSLQLTAPHGEPAVRADSSIGRSFLEANPGYPLVALRLFPGEAYVAATDLVFHDACTIDATKRVFTLQIRVPLRTLTSECLDNSAIAVVD